MPVVHRGGASDKQSEQAQSGDGGVVWCSVVWLGGIGTLRRLQLFLTLTLCIQSSEELSIYVLKREASSQSSEVKGARTEKRYTDDRQTDCRLGFARYKLS